jgi:hypothetical protein
LAQATFLLTHLSMGLLNCNSIEAALKWHKTNLKKNSLQQAAIKYNVKCSTLHDRLHVCVRTWLELDPLDSIMSSDMSQPLSNCTLASPQGILIESFL